MLDEEAHAFLRGLRPRERRRLEREFDLLRDHPFSEPHFIELGAEGEALFHRVVSAYVIVYHVDHAVRRVFVQDIFPNQ